MTTYYVDSAATGTADGLSEANAWTTIDTAMNNVIAGDKVWVKASATYSETPNIDTGGGFATPIIYEGYTTTTGDNGKVTVSGTTNCLTGSVSNMYHIFKNFIFSGASSHGVYCSAGAANAIAFYNCEFNSNGGSGVFGNDIYAFINCEFNSNTSSGCDVDNNTKYVGCIAQGNGSHGLVSTNTAMIYKCVIYNNNSFSDGLNTNGAYFVIGCTLDGENGNTTSDGLATPNSSDIVVVDNIFYDWGGKGVVLSTGAPASQPVVGYNLMNSNATDYNLSYETIGYNDVTSAPAFIDEASDDYRPSSSSPAVDSQIKPGGIT